MPAPCLPFGRVLLGLKASCLLLQTYLLSLWQNSSVFVSSDHKSFKLEGVNFGSGASFLVHNLSGHGDIKLASMWTVMLVFQQFQVDFRLPEQSNLFPNHRSFRATKGLQSTFNQISKTNSNLCTQFLCFKGLKNCMLYNYYILEKRTVQRTH